MKLRTLSLVAAGALLLAACNEDDSPVADNSTTGVVASQIASSTTDTALPIDLNTLVISDADTDEISSPSPVM